AVVASVRSYEIGAAARPRMPTSTGNSSAGSTTPSVASCTPIASSFVIGNAETTLPSSSFTAGSGFTLSGTCSSAYGCAEYQTGVSSATTVPLTIGTSAPWVESAIAFGPARNVSYAYL